MRHTVHIMFGEAFSEALLSLKKYVIMFGDESIEDYFQALLYTQHSNGGIEISKVISQNNDKNHFVSGVNNLFKFEYKQVFESNAEEKNVRLKAFLQGLKNRTITITNPGDFDNLHFCLYFPLYQLEVWKQVCLFIDTLKSEKFATDIDVIGFQSDMVELFTNEDDWTNLPLMKEQYETLSITVLKQVVDYRKLHKGNIAHFIVMQNSQSHGIALGLNKNSFIRIIGEFSLLCTESYNEIFGVGVSEADLQAIGLSMLSFDKYYFIEYLLQRTYLFAMDREKIREKEVDINMASEKAHKLVSKWVNLMSDFFDSEIKPRLDDKLDQNTIVAEITPLLNDEIAKIGDEFEGYIEDENLSIPEKRAILATLLGQDDALFVNYIYNRKQLLVDDLDRQSMMIYIDANNKLLLDEKGKDKALLSPDGETPAEYPLDKIKEVRMRLRQSVAYIRELEKEALKLKSQLTQQEESEKCLIKNGYFVIGGHQYKLMPSDVLEEALTDNYVPHPVKIQSVDLRNDFSNIKDQGKQGSCVAFALTSVYEYFLKREKDSKPNLSEAFLYYNAREKVGKEKEDVGISLLQGIEVLMDTGICIEELCKYDENSYSKRPTEEAYEEAKGRKVKKALNVDCSLNAIKSALDDRFPVIVSLNLYPSFGNNYRGVVSLPTEEEKSSIELTDEQHGKHAMVICGYSDDSKVFIVRNSWGKSFGDKGYCYIPYSYMTDSSLINWACIISEIETYNIIAGKGDVKVLHLDTKDARLMYEITQNLITEEEIYQTELHKEDNELQQYYFKLKQILKNKNIQDDIIDANAERLKTLIKEREIERDSLLEQKNSSLKDFSSVTRTGLLILSGIFVFIGILIYSFYDYFSEDIMYSLVGIEIAIVVIGCIYFPWRNSRKKDLEREWNSQVVQYGVQTELLKKENDTMRLRMHLAGMLLIRLFDLNDRLLNKYNVMKSFISNLIAWYDEEKEEQKKMNADTQPPFISLIRNDILDSYFNGNKEDIIKNIRLWEFLKGYHLSENGIRVFKEDLKENFISNISSMFSDFEIYNYISKSKNYPYLISSYNEILPLLEELDRKSDIFLQCNEQKGSLNPHKVIFIHTNSDEETKKWELTYPDAFSISPMSYNIGSKDKIVVLRLQDLQIEQVCI